MLRRTGANWIYVVVRRRAGKCSAPQSDNADAPRAFLAGGATIIFVLRSAPRNRCLKCGTNRTDGERYSPGMSVLMRSPMVQARVTPDVNQASHREETGRTRCA